MSVATVLLAGAAAVPIGSFLNVVIERSPTTIGLRAEVPESVDGDAAPVVPRTTKWLGVPVHPWILRRGSRAELPERWLLAELSTVAVFMVLATRYGDQAAILPLLVLGASLVAVTFVDLEHLRIPDRITFPTLGLLGVSLVAVSIHLDAEARIRSALVGSVVYFVLLLLPHLVSPKGMGFGDVKLALVMGLALGWVGWHQDAPTLGPLRLVLYALMLGSLLGVVFGLAHSVVTKQRGAFPFGPALALACLVVVIYAPQLRY
jgi:leader peptidase (prepilin peptidase)/N-methyltransferase